TTLSMSIFEEYRTKACGLSSSDRIGHVIARTFDVIDAVVRNGVGSETVCELIELLAQDRAFAMKRDNNVSTPLRELVYGMIESLGSMVEDIAKRRVDELMAVGQASSNALTQSKANSGLSTILQPNLPDNLVKDETYEEQGASQQSVRQQSLLSEDDMKFEFEADFDGSMTNTSSDQLLGGSHANSAEPSSGDYPCTECPRVFTTKNALSGHMGLHSKKKRGRTMRTGKFGPRFDCEQCSYYCASRTALAIHMCTHTGERPYACLHCPEKFVSSSYLKNHQRSLHGLKLYECPMCEEKFDRLAQLTIHKRNHYKIAQPAPTSANGIPYFNQYNSVPAAPSTYSSPTFNPYQYNYSGQSPR
ncbi:hypothetical protein PENTCL1PPCAC_25930, partial [Pristionchus entomophagus]